MALPRLAIATTEIELPISKRVVTIRQYRASEEKALLMVNQKNQNAVTSAMMNLIAACCGDSISKDDLSKLSMVDTLYLYTKLNIISVGAEKTIGVTCQNEEGGKDKDGNVVACKHEVKMKVDLSVIEVSNDGKFDPDVSLGEDTKVSLRLPTMLEMAGIDASKQEDAAYMFDSIISLLSKCTTQMVINGDFISTKDTNVQEIFNWYMDLSHENLQKLVGWYEQIPYLYKTIKWKCSTCGHQNELVIKDITSFFH